MPLFRFPSADQLRVALGSGLVPPAVLSAPALAATDRAGGVWVQSGGDWAPEVARALARLGVAAQAPGTGPELVEIAPLASLVPPVPSDDPSAGPVLVALDPANLGRLAARLPRPLAWRLWIGAERAWVELPAAPPAARLGELGATLYRAARPGLWVEAGFAHPLAARLSVPDGGGWAVEAGGAWHPLSAAFRPSAGAFAWTQASGWHDSAEPPAPIPVDWRLEPDSTGGAAETVWLVPDAGAAGLRAQFAELDDDRLAQLRVARLDASPQLGGRRLVLAVPRGAVVVPALPPGSEAFAQAPGVPHLALPKGRRLAPSVPPSVVANLLKLDPARLTILREVAGRLELVRVARSAFKPAAAVVEYRRPRAVELAAHPVEVRLALPSFVAGPDAPPVPAPAPAPRPRPAAAVPKRRPLWAWLGGRLRRRPPPPVVPAKSPPRPSDSAPPPVRIFEKLASQQTLVMGNEWAARRVRLEQRVLTELPRLDPAKRARLWAELAAVYAAVGQQIDAATAALHAVWLDPEPPAEWLELWESAEARAVRGTGDSGGGAPADSPRLAAAALARLASPAAPTSAASLSLGDPDLVPRLAELVGAREAELPIRAAWLAQRSLAKLAGGDPLRLARASDRLLGRLNEQGPGLDLDAPSFLRFRGQATGERYQAARDWLHRVREPVQRWLARFPATTRYQLAGAGIDADLARTGPYADLMLAWGHAKLGDRSRALALEAQASARLAEGHPPHADPAVTGLVVDLFRRRVRAALEGRGESPGLPADLAARRAGLGELGRYVVDKLRSASGILEPHELVNPYEQRDAAGFLGSDALGEKLRRFLARPTLFPAGGEARQLLALDAEDSTAQSMSRVVYAILEVAPHLDAQLVAAVIPQAVKAIELIPEWLRLSAPLSDPAKANKQFGRRMLLTTCHAAGHFRLADSLRLATEELLSRLDTPDGPTARLVEGVAGPYFHALRRLELNPLAALLVAKLRPGPVVGARELGLAIGRFASGDEEGGNLVLDAARERLFVRGVASDHERTAVAIAYARALGHAPARLAFGRLEELFSRLDPIETASATGRYFALQPLELVDAAVRSVVRDDFAIGPSVRAWLDDDEFTIRGRLGRDFAEALRG